MSSVEEIRTAIERLPKRDLARLRRWFLKYDAEVWDEQFEQDAGAGKLDAFARQALRRAAAADERQEEESAPSQTVG